MLTFLLLACTSAPPAPTGGHSILTPPADTDPDTDRDTGTGVDTSEDSGGTPAGPSLSLSAESYRCSPGDLVDANLQIPQGAVIQSYLLVDESTEEERRFQWMLATDGVVIWDADGADLFCSWTPGPAGVGVFWEGLSAQVVAVRVVWVAQE